MNGNTVTIGKYGENIAAEYLIAQGFTITERNYRNEHREIDLIAESETHILFVEVKTRSYSGIPENSPYGRPGRAVGASKKKLTVAAARAYLHDHPQQKQPRMDVIEVYLKKSATSAPQLIKLHWIKNAYGQNG